MNGSFTKPKNKSAYLIQLTAFTWLSSGSQPTIGTGQAARSVEWARDGENMQIKMFMKIGSSGMGAGTGTYFQEVKIANPAGGFYYIDQQKTLLGTGRAILGLFSFYDSSTGYVYNGGVQVYSFGDSTNGFQIGYSIPTISGSYGTSSLWSATVPVAPAASDEFYSDFSIPIVGWNP